MKKIIILSIMLVILTGCTKTTGNIKWNTMAIIPDSKKYERKIDWDKVEVGDILIQECNGDFLGWFGHSGIVVGYDKVAEIPSIGQNVYYNKFKFWKKTRRMAVLRLKGIDEEFRQALVKEIEKSIGKIYLILPKDSEFAYYCSSYVWSIFYHTGKKLGKKIDLDSNGGIFVMPWDFIGDDDLEIIDIMKD